MSSSPHATMVDMDDVPPAEMAWRFTVQVLAPAERAPQCSSSTSLLACPSTRLHDLVQMVEHGGPFPMSARHLHLVVQSNATLGDCLTDPPVDDSDGGGSTSDAPPRPALDLARTMSASNLTAQERLELTQVASRIHRRLAQQRGVYPEPTALQTATWLTTRAYMMLALEDSELDFTEAEPSTSSSHRVAAD